MKSSLGQEIPKVGTFFWSKKPPIVLNSFLTALLAKLRAHEYIETIGYSFSTMARLLGFMKGQKCWECLLVSKFWRISDFANTFWYWIDYKICARLIFLLRAVRKNPSDIYGGIMLIAAHIFLFPLRTIFSWPKVVKSESVSIFTIVFYNENLLYIFRDSKMDFRPLELLESWNKKMWAAMGWYPPRISKEKIQSLRSSENKRAQIRSKTFQLSYTDWEQNRRVFYTLLKASLFL